MYYALLSLEYICHNRKIHLVTLFVTVVVLFILLYYPYFPPKELLNFPDKGIPNHKILVFVSIMLVVYALVLYFIGKQYFWFKSIFILLVIFEIAYLSNVTVNNIDAASAEDLSQKKAYNDYTLDAVAYVGRIDNSFFRIDKTYFSSAAWYGSFNDGLVQGYKGTSCYNPTNQLYYIHYLQLMGISNRAYESESREPIGLINRPVLESLNQVKYMLTKNSAPLFWKIACDSITATGDVKIFRNNFVLPLGFTYKYYIRESAFENIPNNQKDLVSLKACVLKDNEINKFPGLHEFELKDTFVASAFNAELYRKEINELRKDTLVLNNSGETFFRGKITVDEDKMMYLSIPYDKGWKLKVDGYPAEKIILDGGMTGVMFSPGSHSIEMVYDLRFFKKGLMLSVLGFIIYIGLWVYQKKKNPALRLQ